MGVDVNWTGPDKAIIQYEFPDQWTWDDLYQAMDQVNMMMSTVPHTVYVVVSFENSKGIPPGALTHLRIGSLKGAPNWGGGVFIGANSLLTALLNTFTLINKKMGERYSIAKSYDEAMAIIEKWRANTSPPSP